MIGLILLWSAVAMTGFNKNWRDSCFTAVKSFVLSFFQIPLTYGYKLLINPNFLAENEHEADVYWLMKVSRISIVITNCPRTHHVFLS